MSANSEQLPEGSPQESVLRNQEKDPQASNPTPQVSQKTQGVKPPRDNGIGVLQSAAKKAAASNSRSDVHEYMRLRRSFI
ncbi:MAG: hypothetical protein ACYTE1_09680 [Planctomycetota bacterium]|jgi:hypothetical protein